MPASELLRTVRMCVRDMNLKNAAVKTVLAEAEKHGWDRLISSMSNERQAALIRMLAEDHQATHAVLGNVVSIYEHIIEELVAMAERELDDMAIEMDDAQERKHTNWLGLLAAGGVGYVIGKRA